MIAGNNECSETRNMANWKQVAGLKLERYLYHEYQLEVREMSFRGKSLEFCFLSTYEFRDFSGL